MLKKLKEIGAYSLDLPLSKKEALFGELEEKTGELPSDYRDMLLYFGGSIMFDSIMSFKGETSSPWADNNGYDDIEYFYGLSCEGHGHSILDMIETYKDDFRMQWIPIGFSSGGNQICLCIQGSKKEQIWFWDHESDPVFDNDNVYSGLTFIAPNLKAFIAKLKKEDDLSSPSKAIGGFLDF